MNLAAVVVVAVSWWAPPETKVALAHLGTWFLLFGAPRAVVELQRRAVERGQRVGQAQEVHALGHLAAAGIAVAHAGAVGMPLADRGDRRAGVTGRRSVARPHPGG